ncbi:MAG: nucleotidyltransferase substrate binding protein [Elusimicrobia bacterium]|nr:nucleotidyltransferase substrate binding protein [Candidatus Obscuribacterium magneticum]
MEPTEEKLKADLILLEKAVGTLEEALKATWTDLVRDAVIQRFEYVFELAWKSIKAAAQYMGTACNSPREAVRIAYKMGWIDDTDAWFEAMEARNKTSHIYDENTAGEVYNVAKKYPKLIRPLLISLKGLKE